MDSLQKKLCACLEDIEDACNSEDVEFLSEVLKLSFYSENFVSVDPKIRRRAVLSAIRETTKKQADQHKKGSVSLVQQAKPSSPGNPN